MFPRADCFRLLTPRALTTRAIPRNRACRAECHLGIGTQNRLLLREEGGRRLEARVPRRHVLMVGCEAVRQHSVAAHENREQAVNVACRLDPRAGAHQ